MVLEIYHYWMHLWSKGTAPFGYMMIVSKVDLMSPFHGNNKQFHPLPKAPSPRLLYSWLLVPKTFFYSSWFLQNTSQPFIVFHLTATTLLRAIILSSLSQSCWSSPLAKNWLAMNVWCNYDQWYRRENLLRAFGKGSHIPRKRHLERDGLWFKWTLSFLDVTLRI